MSRPRVNTACRGTLLALIGSLALSGCGGDAARSDETPQQRSVLLICLDTVRADRLGCYGYDARPTTPALDALAERGVLFRDTSSTAGWTKPSVPSFFTGTWPAQHGVYEGSARGKTGAVTDVLGSRARTIAESFSAAGYETAAFIHNAQLKLGNGFEQGFDSYRDRMGDARDIRWKALDWVDERESGQPFFLYLHILDAHWPYDIPDEAAERFADGLDISMFRGGDSRALRDAINDGLVVLDESQRAALDALYDASLRWIDDELAHLFAGLAQRGLLDDMTVCVVSDHGEEFLEHGRIGHGHGLWENLLSVPWILAGPEVEPQVVTRPVSLVDLPATLLAASGVAPAEPPEGTDQLSGMPRSTPLFAEHKAPDKYLQSLRVGSWKILRSFRPPERDDADKQGSEAFALRQLGDGGRWEAELEIGPDGALRATQFKPRDEPPGDPIEIRGPVAELGPGRFTIAGVPVSHDERTARSGETDAIAAGLRAGSVVKVRGVFADGTLVAERIKHYAPGTDDTPELRGPVHSVLAQGSSGELVIGAVRILFDADTAWKDVDTEVPRRLAREQILGVLERNADDAAAGGWTVDLSLYDLLRDPGEQQPIARWTGQQDATTPEDLARLSDALDRLGASLAERRLWSEADQAVLSEEALGALRAIGYVR